jgi:hypothetical protein
VPIARLAAAQAAIKHGKTEKLASDNVTSELAKNVKEPA